MLAAYATAIEVPVIGAFPSPEATASHVVVDVVAAALTNLDIAVAEGRHYFSPKTYPFVIGRECVACLPSGGRAFFNVNAVASGSGSMAEKVLVDSSHALPVPEGVSDILAAALGNAGLAAWLPLSWRARLKPGETVLILGATGASGLIAVAAARLLGAGRIIAAGRNPAALARARRLGADAVVNLSSADDLAAAFTAAAGGGIDVVVDYLNGPPAEAALKAMATGGRIVQIGSTLGSATSVPAQLARKQLLDVLGFAYYHAPIAEQAEAYARLCQHTIAGDIEIDVEALPLANFAEAWHRQKAGGSPRLVLQP